MSPEQTSGGALDREQQGVIHDIGYRRYDGPRLGRQYVARSMFVESAKGAYGLGRSSRTKVVPMLCLAAMCVPAVVASVIGAVTGADEPSISYTSYVLNLQLLVAVFVGAQAPAAVSRDLRFRVMSLYFSRPMLRTDYVQAKYLAFTAAVFVLLAVPLTILFLGSLLAEMPLGEQIPDYLRALVAALVLSFVLAGIGLLIAAFTPRRGIGVAAIITVLLVLIGVQAAVQNIALEEGSDTLAGYAGALSPFTLVDGLAHGVLGADTALPVDPPGATGAAVFALLVVLLVAACYGLLVLRYRKVSVS